MAEGLVDLVSVPSISLVIPASIRLMELGLGVFGVATSVAPCLSIAVAYVRPWRPRTPVLLLRGLGPRQSRGFSGPKPTRRVQ